MASRGRSPTALKLVDLLRAWAAEEPAPPPYSTAEALVRTAARAQTVCCWLLEMLKHDERRDAKEACARGRGSF